MCIRSDNSYPLLRVYLLLDFHKRVTLQFERTLRGSMVISHSFCWSRNPCRVYTGMSTVIYFKLFGLPSVRAFWFWAGRRTNAHDVDWGGTVIDDRLRTDNEYRRCTDHVFKTRQSIFCRLFALAVSKFDGTSAMLMFGRSQIYVTNTKWWRRPCGGREDRTEYTTLK